MRVALIGATGLVGSLLAPKLAAAGHDLHLLQRRPGSGAAGTEHVAPPEEWPEIVRALKPEAAISTLGTTMRKAGSEAGFRAVDHEMVLAFARAARAAGTRRFASVSSVGADAQSKNFYLRIKGETDGTLAALGFERVDIFRPGLLIGARGADRRTGERIAIAMSPIANLLLRGRFARYAGIRAEAVATAIAASLEDNRPGRFVHENEAILELGRHWTLARPIR
jgi:uncharacterized protein YbjT (DUF2867 family)